MDDVKKLWPKIRRLEEAKDAGGMGSVEQSPKVMLLPEAQYEFAAGYNSGEMTLTISQLPATGDEITITLDGLVYSATVKPLSLDGIDLLYAGNAKNIDLPDTGEPFFVSFMDLDEGRMLGMVVYDGEPTHTVGISYRTVTIHPINPKFLPEGVGGGLPVVDFTSVTIPPVDEGAAVMVEVPEAPESLIAELFSKTTPTVCKFKWSFYDDLLLPEVTLNKCGGAYPCWSGTFAIEGMLYGIMVAEGGIMVWHIHTLSNA